MKDFLQKAKAVIVGHAVGDALGVPVESRSREYLDKNPVTDMTGFGVYPVPKGSWSDDTSMSLCALTGIAEQSGKVGVMQNFVKWLNYDEFTPTGVTFDAGSTCTAAIMAFIGGESVYSCGQNGEYSNGNGSLMRIHPFTLYAIKSFNKMTFNHIELISEASALTHAHPRSRAACVLYSFILWELLENPCKQSVAAGLNNARRVYAHYCEEWGTHIDEYDELPKFQSLFDGIQTLDKNSIQSSAYVLHTLEAAIWCLLTTNSYKECVLKAVNLGRDTDTTAAVAGGLAGALYGYDAIPEEWRNSLLRREYIEELCEKAFKTKEEINSMNDEIKSIRQPEPVEKFKPTYRNTKVTNDAPYYEEPDFDYIIIKTTEDRVAVCGGSLYEATRRYWRLNVDRAEHYKYVFSVIGGIVQNVYCADYWKRVYEKPYDGRYEFFGSEAPKEIAKRFIGKRIPPRFSKPGMASPVLYSD